VKAVNGDGEGWNRHTRDIQQAWGVGNMLLQEHGQQHIMLGPVILQNITAQQATLLNSNLFHPEYDKKITDQRFKAGPIVFQLMQSAPLNSIMFHYWSGNGNTEKVEKEYRAWIASLTTTEGDNNKELFRSNMRTSLKALKKTVSAQTCLLNDFQFLITPTGGTYLMDMDNCSPRRRHKSKFLPKEELVQSCLKVIDRLAEILEEETKRIISPQTPH
jgi:hypothetical protein